ncbi:fungal-specific transcription factor [Plectosphaerella plurivora]|uniref:Fungal-specific transcription factor n=1 Tax=Plectosphaerella plurivora TaxID=936078 RepID=A0A9P9AFS2_9PEZI|nr:fungal-specific transcription factor [Plectosphaerella plurivora]
MCTSYLRELEGRQGSALTPGSVSTPRARRQSQLSQEPSGSHDISPPAFAAPRRPSPVHERPREEAHHAVLVANKSAALNRLADSALGSDEPHGIESPFRQNPLADNDYTFAKMAGRYWYMGPSSSWSFCRRVLALLGQRLPASSYVPDPQHLDAGALKLRWRPVAYDEVPDTSNLPPLDYAILLFNTARFYLGSIAYLIDEKDFLKNLHELYEDPIAKATSARHWFAVYLLVLAYGKVFIVNQSSPEGPAGYQYAVRAMALMPDLSGLDADAIHAVQALTLGAVYLQSIDMRLGALQHIGHALRICIIEGWHRHMPEEVVGIEHSRRCNTIFWVVYRLDREFGPLMGAPSSIRDEDITAKAPSELDGTLDALNMTLHTRLARLMARILTAIYGVGQQFDGSLVTNTQEVLRDLAQLSKDINALLNEHFQGSISRASRMALRLILSYHHCVVLTTRPLVMCALHIHVKQTDTIRSGSISLSQPVASLLQSCVDSAQTVLRILRVIGDEDLLEAFLPFQLEDAFSSAFILYLVRTVSPALIQDDGWSDNVRSIMDKMISKGSIVAPLRKLELAQLEHIMGVFTPLGDDGGHDAPPTPAASSAAAAAQGGMEQDDGGQDMSMDEPGWDLFMSNGMVGISPGEMLDLAAQLEVGADFSAGMSWDVGP